MKEAVGNTIVFNWVIFFVFLIMLLLVGSLMYSRAFKTRNEIITIIERNQGYNAKARTEINNFLGNIGYRRISDYQGRTITGRNTCRIPQPVGRWESVDIGNEGFVYCVYRNRNENYYRVEVFLHLDIPVLGEFLTYPVNGETRAFVDWSR